MNFTNLLNLLTGLLGVSIRFCSFQNANENVWRILDVRHLTSIIYLWFLINFNELFRYNKDPRQCVQACFRTRIT